jgi:hypothetical protein
MWKKSILSIFVRINTNFSYDFFLHPVRINRNFGLAMFGLTRLYCTLLCIVTSRSVRQPDVSLLPMQSVRALTAFIKTVFCLRILASLFNHNILSFLVCPFCFLIVFFYFLPAIGFSAVVKHVNIWIESPSSYHVFCQNDCWLTDFESYRLKRSDISTHKQWLEVSLP